MSTLSNSAITFAGKSPRKTRIDELGRKFLGSIIMAVFSAIILAVDLVFIANESGNLTPQMSQIAAGVGILVAILITTFTFRAINVWRTAKALNSAL